MKFLVFSDLHINRFPYSNITKEGKDELLEAGLSIIDQVNEFAVKNSIKDIIFLGDLFHIRAKLDSDIYSNLVYKKFKSYFSKKESPNLIIIPGNHDQIDKSGKHNLLPYSELENITIINDFYKSNELIFCPHQYYLDNLYDYLSKESNEESIIFMHQLLINTPTMSGAIFKKNEAVDTSRFKFKHLFSGHNHRPFKNDKLGIYNIGSPMHHDFGDAECPERFFVYYNNSEVIWVETNFPKFALHGSKEAKKASYIKKKSKKVESNKNRIEINFNDDIDNIMKVYLDTIETSLDKEKLLTTGLSLFKV